MENLLDEAAAVVRSFTGATPARTADGGLRLPNDVVFYPDHLADRVRGLDDAERGSEIRRTITELLLPDELEGLPFSEIRPLLRAAVRPIDPTMPVLARPVSVDLGLVPFADRPTSFVTVSAARIAAWGLTLDEVLAIGLSQLERPAVQRTDVGGGVPLLVVQSEDLMTTGWLARLGDLVPELGPDGDWAAGAVVAVPARTMLLISPLLTDVAIGETVGAVARAAANLAVRLLGGISPHSYLWAAGATTYPRWRSTGATDAVVVVADDDAAPIWAGDPPPSPLLRP